MSFWHEFGLTSHDLDVYLSKLVGSIAVTRSNQLWASLGNRVVYFGLGFDLAVSYSARERCGARESPRACAGVAVFVSRLHAVHVGGEVATRSLQNAASACRKIMVYFEVS